MPEANSLWIGREPTVFRHGGKKLSPMTFLLLSLGRAVMQKIIAEKDKRGRKEEKQKGMRSNTVAFPQAKIRELVTTELPATSMKCIVFGLILLPLPWRAAIRRM